MFHYLETFHSISFDGMFSLTISFNVPKIFCTVLYFFFLKTKITKSVMTNRHLQLQSPYHAHSHSHSLPFFFSHTQALIHTHFYPSLLLLHMVLITNWRGEGKQGERSKGVEQKHVLWCSGPNKPCHACVLKDALADRQTH